MAIKYLPFAGTYGTAIPFDQPCTAMGEHTVAGAITFTVNATDPQVTYGAILRLVADGVNVPNLSAFKVVGAGAYDNTASMVNQLIFFFDGVDYCVAINQLGTSGGGGGDVTAPTITSIVVEDATPDKLRIYYNESLDTSSIPSNSNYIKNEGGAGSGFTGTPVVGTNYVELTLSPAMANGDVWDLGYTGSAVKDLAGNSAGTFSIQPITNNVGAGGGSYDAATLAWIAAEETKNSSTMSTTMKDAADDVVTALKAGTLWAKMKSVHLISESGTLNLKDPDDDDASFHLEQVAGSGATIDANGWTFDGVNDALNTNFIPATHVTQWNQHYSIYIKTTAATGYVYGAVGSGHATYFSPKDGSNINFRIQSGGDLNGGANANTAGRYVASVINNSGTIQRRLTKNGSVVYTQDSSSGTDTGQPVPHNTYLGAFYNDGSGLPANFFAGTVGWLTEGEGLTDAEITELDGIMSTFITATSRT